nr:T9SS type A sorting domain-containing protein [Ferruginibacter sp.]
GWWCPGWGWWGWWQGWGWWGPGYGNPNPGNPWGWKGNSNATIATETTKGGVAAPEANDFEIYNLKVAPNPSSTEFVLQVNTTNNTDRMLVNIYDVSGKIYKQFKANPTQLIKFGTGMRPGTYLVEVLQAGHRKTATVIKL